MKLKVLQSTFSPIFLPEKELDRLVEERTLEPVKHSEWASSIVAVLKPDKQSVFKQTINPVLKLDRYSIPKVEAKLSMGKQYTKLDLSIPSGAYRRGD